MSNNELDKNEYDSYNNYINDLAFKHYAESLAKKKSDELIGNGESNHAKIIIENLLLNADKEICIFSSGLAKGIFDNEAVINSLINFLDRPDTSIKIILQDRYQVDKLKRKRRFIETCLEYDKKCEISNTNLDDSEIKEHFVVMDNSGYRFCPDKGKAEAVASFNRPFTAKHLRKQFEILQGRSKPLFP